MKINYSESQYIQLAREQFCRTISEIPFVSDIEIFLTGLQRGFGDFHAIVHFEDSEKPSHFWIEVSANGERRYVNSFMLMASQHENEDCYVFMAPYFSEESAELMKKRKYSYMDLSGNCYILTRRIFLYVRGQANQYIEKRERRNYLSKSSRAASAIMRTMLDEPDKEWQVVTLMEKSGKAIGTVSNVKRFLQDKDWILEEQKGFKLCNIKEMLYTWSREYHKKNAYVQEFYSLDSVSEIEHEIATWSKAHDESAILGGFSAAARYAPVVRYKKAEVYIEQQYFEEFITDLELKRVEAGGNILVTVPHDETPCLYSKEINNSIVTSPAQTILDLLGKAGRGEEAADAIVMKFYKGR